MAGSPDDLSRADVEQLARVIARELGADPVLVLSGSRRVECRRARHRWRVDVAERLGLRDGRATLAHVAEVLRCDVESLRRTLRREVFGGGVEVDEVASLRHEPRAHVDAGRTRASDRVSHVNDGTQSHVVTQDR